MSQPTTDTDAHQCLVQYDREHYITLECSCGEVMRVGYAPTPAELWATEQAHRTTVFKGPDVVHSSHG